MKLFDATGQLLTEPYATIPVPELVRRGAGGDLDDEFCQFPVLVTGWSRAVLDDGREVTPEHGYVTWQRVRPNIRSDEWGPWHLGWEWEDVLLDYQIEPDTYEGRMALHEHLVNSRPQPPGSSATGSGKPAPEVPSAVSP